MVRPCSADKGCARTMARHGVPAGPSEHLAAEQHLARSLDGPGEVGAIVPEHEQPAPLRRDGPIRFLAIPCNHDSGDAFGEPHPDSLSYSS